VIKCPVVRKRRFVQTGGRGAFVVQPGFGGKKRFPKKGGLRDFFGAHPREVFPPWGTRDGGGAGGGIYFKTPPGGGGALPARAG